METARILLLWHLQKHSITAEGSELISGHTGETVSNAQPGNSLTCLTNM